MLPRPVSTVSALVAALARLQTAVGSVSVPALLNLLISAAEEEVLGDGASQVAAVAEAVPGAQELQRRDALRGCGRPCEFQVRVRVVDVVADADGTPPTASDIFTTPEKSSLMKWSMGMPVSWWTVATCSPGPY